MKTKPTKETVEKIINAYNLIKDFACPCNVIDNVYNFIESDETPCYETTED